MKTNVSALRVPIIPKRVRAINGQSFAFIPHRFLRDGFLSSLSREELSLYLFLLLAADRSGVSFYGYDAICSILRMPLEQYIEARNGLIAKDLIAFDGTRFQVLSLPVRPIQTKLKPLKTDNDFEKHDPATIRAMISAAFDDDNNRPQR
jgi:hypothetical protein